MTGVLTLSRGPHWNVPEVKLRRVGNAYGALIDYYFPDEAAAGTSLLTGAIVATGAAFGPPLLIDAVQAQQKAMRGRTGFAAAPAAATPGVPPIPPVPPPPADLGGMSDAEMENIMRQAQAMMQAMFTPPPDAPGDDGTVIDG